MIIGFDVNSIYGTLTGVGKYSLSLINTLRKLYENDIFKFYSYAIRTGPRKQKLDIFPSENNVTYPMFFNHGIGFYVLWNYLKWPRVESMIGEVDIVHGLSWLVPATKKAKKVVTIHDLTSLTHPDYHPTWRAKLYPRYIDYSVNNSDAIFTVSESTKADILKFFKINPDKITVSYNGVDSQIFYPLNDENAVEAARKKLGITKKYIYYLGTIEPRKNVDKLVDAFLNAQKMASEPLQLVLSGMIGWKVDGLMKKITSYAASKDIIYTGYIDIKDAVALYNGADAFVYPSQYEGFGIPVAEAMACGCPVITSNVSSLPEVAGNAGILVNPNDIDELTDSIFKVVEDVDLRKQMKIDSIKQSRKFTWENTAKTAYHVYEKILSE